MFCPMYQNIMLFIAYIQLTSHVRPSFKQNSDKIHPLKMLSATGRTTLAVHTFCPPPVICVKHRNDCFLITDFLFFRDGAVDTESCQELIGKCIDKMRESNDLPQSFSRSSEGVN